MNKKLIKHLEKLNQITPSQVMEDNEDKIIKFNGSTIVLNAEHVAKVEHLRKSSKHLIVYYYYDRAMYKFIIPPAVEVVITGKGVNWSSVTQGDINYQQIFKEDILLGEAHEVYFETEECIYLDEDICPIQDNLNEHIKHLSGTVGLKVAKCYSDSNEEFYVKLNNNCPKRIVLLDRKIKLVIFDTKKKERSVRYLLGGETVTVHIPARVDLFVMAGDGRKVKSI